MLRTRYFFVDEFSEFIEEFKKYDHEVVKFNRGDYVKGANENFQHIYLFLEGLCRISVLHDSGEERIIGYFGHGSLYPIIAKEQNFYLEYSILMEAATETTALKFDVETFKKMVGDNVKFTYEIINHYCKYTNLLLYNITSESYEPLLNRVASIIIIYYLNFNSRDIPLTQNEMASLVGARRSSVVKVLKNFRDGGLIKTCNSKIVILDIEKLLELASALIY